MPDAERDLRATSESIQDDAEVLANLEARKLSLNAGDPEVDRLSEAIQRLVARIGVKATAERELAAEIGISTPDDPSAG
jgi:hypothetical protein